MSTPFIQLYIGDYLRDTGALSTEGHGAYILILFAMWNADGWVPTKKLATFARMSPAKWARVEADILPLLIFDNDSCSQNRLLVELEKASGKSLKRSEAGKRGVEAKRLKNNDALQANASALLEANGEQTPNKREAMLKHSSETITINQTDMSADADVSEQKIPARSKKKAPRGAEYPADFEEFWSAYPTDRLMSKKTAAAQWKRLSEADRSAAKAAIPGFKAHCKSNPTYRPVHAERFLSQRRFDGFSEGGAGGKNAAAQAIAALEAEARGETSRH